MNILIVGSTGKVGKFISKKLESKFNIYKISKQKNNSTYYDFDNLKGDLNQLSNLKFDVIINCLGVLPSQNYSKKTFFNVNSNSIKLLAQHVNNNSLFIQLSTISVYGESISSRDIFEDDILNPKNIYSISKLKGEEYVQTHFKKNFIFRIPPIYTNYSDKTLYKRIIKNKFFEVKFGDDNQKHSYCSLDQLYKIIFYVIKHKLPYGIYHVTDRNLLSIKFLKSLIKEKPLIKLRVNPKLILFIIYIFKLLRLKNLENRINEIYYKSCINNIYSTKKISKHIKL